jgi:hypothetical protein
MTMKKLALAAVGALGLASVALTALPVAAQPLPLVKADYWCGPGWHLNAWNRCVRNYPAYGYYGYGPTFVFGFGRDRDRDFRDRGDFRGDRGDRGDFRGDRGDHWRR